MTKGPSSAAENAGLGREAPLTPEVLRKVPLEGNETDVLDYAGCEQGRHVSLWAMN